MDELQISGKRFISSRRIARDNGYTSDYIGQLIRGGKVIGQKVGRAWYVDAVSFDTFLGSESIPAKLPEEKIPVEIAPAQLPEEKVLGSASPQPDHFLQEVLPPQVSAPVVENPAPVEKTPEPAVVAEEIKVEEKKEVEEIQHIPLRIVEAEAPAGLRYYADNEPSLPEIRSNKSESRIARPAVKKEEIAAATHAYKPPKLAMVAFGGAALAVFVFSAVLSSTLSLNISIEAGNTASAWYSLGW